MSLVRNYSGGRTETSFLDYLEQVTSTTVCLFGKLTPNAEFGGAAAVGFTNNTRDVYLSAHNLNFSNAPSITPTVIEILIGTEPSNIESVLQFSSTAITEKDIEAGKWNGASLELWLMNWADLTYGEFVIFKGFLGVLKNYQTFFKSEAESENALLKNNFGRVISRLCSLPVKEFGDFYCKKDLSGLSPEGWHITKVLSVSSAETNGYQISMVRSSENVDDTFYENGKMVGVVGQNAGIRREIKFNYGKDTAYLNLELKRPFPYPIAPLDTFTMIAGCNRTLERCIYWGMIANRRAEDWVPGVENATRVIRATN